MHRALVAAGLILAAVSLAGAPLTSGFAAKNALKYCTTLAPESWAHALAWMLPLTGISTTLLVGRFLFLSWPRRQPAVASPSSTMMVSWGILTVCIPVLAFGLPLGDFVTAKWASLEAAKVWSAIWPLTVAGIIGLVLFAFPALRRPLGKIRVPPGDLIVPVEMFLTWCLRIWNRMVVGGFVPVMGSLRAEFTRWQLPNFSKALIRAEQRLGSDLTAGFLVGLLVVVMIALILTGTR
jgi:hypothetical protein